MLSFNNIWWWRMSYVGMDWKKIYRHALDSGYRFLSYGDSSLLMP